MKLIEVAQQDNKPNFLFDNYTSNIIHGYCGLLIDDEDQQCGCWTYNERQFPESWLEELMIANPEIVTRQQAIDEIKQTDMYKNSDTSLPHLIKKFLYNCDAVEKIANRTGYKWCILMWYGGGNPSEHALSLECCLIIPHNKYGEGNLVLALPYFEYMEFTRDIDKCYRITDVKDTISNQQLTEQIQQLSKNLLRDSHMEDIVFHWVGTLRQMPHVLHDPIVEDCTLAQYAKYLCDRLNHADWVGA